MTLNPPTDACIARSDSKLTPYAKTTTKDSDIERIQWLHIDLDPKRPTGVQATQSEVDYSQKKALEIRTYLDSHGITDPVFSFSGNGYNLDYRVDLENTKENVTVLRATLKHLSDKFTDNDVDIDLTTYNPARIVKLFGCLSCKGENIPERSYRYSKIISVPESITVNDISFIKSLIAVKTASAISKVSNTDIYTVEDWLNSYNLNFTKKIEGDGRELFVFDVCPWNGEHKNGSAFVTRFPDGGLMAKCHHNSCQGNDLDSLFKLYPPHSPLVPQKQQKAEKSAADTLLDLATRNMEFFRDTEHHAYVSYNDDGKKCTVNAESDSVCLFLRSLYYNSCRKAIGKDILRQVAETLDMFGKTSHDIRLIHKRVAFENGSLFYDLCDPHFQTVRISSTSCAISGENIPVCFIKDANLKAQILPDLSADPCDLLDYITQHFRVKNEQESVLLAVYIVSCFLEQIGHPILIIHGEKGSAKSTSMRIIQQIVSPSVSDLLAIPKTKEDLAVVLSQSYFVAFDNLRMLDHDKSDLLCMATTGGKYMKRKLYTDGEGVTLSLKNCVACNGINVIADQPDLLDRALLIELERIPENERQTDAYVWSEFQKDLPQILGCCFNALSKALGFIDQLKFDSLPRMADFMRWGCAIAMGMGLDYKIFRDAYFDNIRKAQREPLNGNGLAECLMAFLKRQNGFHWKGTWAELYEHIKAMAYELSINPKDGSLPKAPAVLSRKMKEIRSNLEAEGIFYETGYDHDSKIVTLRKL